MNTEQDVRDLLGMRSRAALSIVVLYAVTCFTCALSTLDGMTTPWPALLAAVVCVAGGFTLIGAPGDPLPREVSLGLIAVGPVSSGLVFSAMPVPATSALQTWPLGCSVAIYTFMCVRGRTISAWIGLAAMIGTAIAWAVITGQGIGYAIGLSAINVAPLLMATFFALTIRPLGRSIFELRAQSTVRVASEAAASAVLDERDAQLRRLDHQARPLLGRIVAGPELLADDILVCQLLEADLRDSLRARALADTRLSQAARAARSRGVQVVMLDDRGDAELDDSVHAALTSSAAEELDGLAAGSATVRLLPAGRPVLATMLVDAGETYRIEYGHDGEPIERDPT